MCRKRGILPTYDAVAKYSQEATVPEVFFDEEKIRDVEEEFLNNLVNYQNSSEKHEDPIIEASNDEPCDFETDMLCMFSGLIGNEKQLDNVLMHVDEEVRLLEEIVEAERYFEHVLTNFENDGIDREIVMIEEAEDKKMKVCDDNQLNIFIRESK